MIEKETADRILTEMEKLRQRHEHETGIVDWAIRVCQAITANEAGYKNRNDWSTAICEKLRKDKSFQKELSDLFSRRIRNKKYNEVSA
jgi:hypothetical protein